MRWIDPHPPRARLPETGTLTGALTGTKTGTLPRPSTATFTGTLARALTGMFGTVALVSCASLTGCGTAREQSAPERTAASTAAVSAQTPPASVLDAGSPDGGEETEPLDAGDPDSTAPPPEPEKKREGELAHFYTALDGLTKGTRKDHVRVLWLGDSHGQADFWTGRVRTLLQKRFGNAGPGFVHIAYKGYRHDGVDLSQKDKWTVTPKNPAASAKVADGIFGLGGLLTTPTDPGSNAGVELRDATLTGTLHFDVCYRMNKPGDAVEIALGSKKPVTLKNSAKKGDPSPLLHWTTTIPAEKGLKLTVSPAAGYPSFCGVVIESDPTTNAGVVLDALGINGARYTTALGWAEEPWLAEFMRRSPDLVIFEYGTNESGDVGIKEETYEDRVTRLVTRIRTKKPDTDCVVLAPTERSDQEERSARIRNIFQVAARKNGCWFWDTIDAMGGKGSMRKWQSENPVKGAKDGVHLTVKGYQFLGDKLAEDLLRKY
ncbi:MAG: GDSL-type esterase/lipase family protein [Polyangiaceae bacterium]